MTAIYQVRYSQRVKKDGAYVVLHTVCVNNGDMHGWWPVRVFRDLAKAEAWTAEQNCAEQSKAGVLRALMTDDFACIAYEVETRAQLTPTCPLRELVPDHEDYDIVVQAFRAGHSSFTIGGGNSPAIMIVAL